MMLQACRAAHPHPMLRQDQRFPPADYAINLVVSPQLGSTALDGSLREAYSN